LVVVERTATAGLATASLGRGAPLVPFMYSLLLLEHLSRRLILFVMPIARTGTPPGFFINLALVALMIVGLVLSLRSQVNPQALE